VLLLLNFIVLLICAGVIKNELQMEGWSSSSQAQRLNLTLYFTANHSDRE